MEVPQIRDECVDCPVIARCMTRLAILTDRRENLISRTEREMSQNVEDEAYLQKAANFLEELSQMPAMEIDKDTADEATEIRKIFRNEEGRQTENRKHHERAESIFSHTEEEEEDHRRTIERNQSMCKNGPVRQRKFGLFGKYVVRCGGEPLTGLIGSLHWLPKKIDY